MSAASSVLSAASAHMPGAKTWLRCLILAALLLVALLAWQYWQFATPRLNSASQQPIATASQSSELTIKPEGYLAEERFEYEPDGNTGLGISAVKTRISIDANSTDPDPAPEFHDEPVQFKRSSSNLNPVLLQAWEAFRRGDDDLAEQLYRKVLVGQSRQRDALLGLAALHIKRGEKGKAGEIYRQLLQLNPQDQMVQGAVLMLEPEQIGSHDEVQLTQRGIQDEPLLLAQHYARHQRWHEAQAQFFAAWQQDPEHPDLAYSLAISLDHLQQNRLAADFYQQALVLAGQRQAGFDRAQVEARLQQLKKLQESVR
ncbi:tetratricopeptide repeat protein [Chitinibacter sp. S2-10]|uniref:tetratricopeptide repeat protein n=1 Tax=Chitinibacter sp. S2-10 TaxID=3373597 RepID=UPI00397782F4